MTESQYHQVAAGEYPAPAEERWEELRDWVPQVDAIVQRGIELLYQFVNLTPDERPEDWECLDDWVERSVSPKVIHYPEHYNDRSRRQFRRVVCSRVMALALDMAQMSTLYWGIEDPTVEGWCSYCKTPRPIAEFVSSKYTCDTCYQRRKG